MMLLQQTLSHFLEVDQSLRRIILEAETLKHFLVICYPSFNNQSIEACSQDRIEKLSTVIDSLNPFEEKRDFFATSILSESINLQFDGEGRISLSARLLKHAKIKNSILFVGQGQTFQIWEPTAFEKFKVSARRKANLNRASLKWEKHFNNNEGK